ncbi:MAG: mucoidy inhibitor MuiA family protein, partial [Bacteroidia bacterium]
MQNISSKINRVTVYPNQAEIERSAEIELSAGSHELVFAHLTDKLSPQSVQVLASDNLWLFDIRTERQQLTEQGHPKLKVFKEEEERLLQVHKNQVSRQTRLQQQKNFVIGLGNRVTTATEQSHEAEWSPDNWQKLLQFYGNQLERLDTDLLSLEKDLIDTQKKLDQVRRQIQDLGRNQARDFNVRLRVEVEKDSKIQLGLKYLVNDASWKPLYDLRVDSGEERLTCVYKAQVRQNTGEDWNGVNLALSTSQPSISGNPPELRPQFVRPKPTVIADAAFGGAPKMVRSAAPKKMASRSMPMAEEADMAPQTPSAKRKESVVESGVLSTSFSLEGVFDVPTDNQAHEVHIRSLELPTKFYYLCIPRLQSKVYLQAELTNESDYPLLPGKASVFLDGQYVNQTPIPMVAQGETYRQGLGIDQRIKLEHKLLQKHR